MFIFVAICFGNKVTLFLAIAGGVACVPLCFVLPIIITNGILGTDEDTDSGGGFSWQLRWFHNGYMVLGILAGVTTLVVGLINGDGEGGH